MAKQFTDTIMYKKGSVAEMIVDSIVSDYGYESFGPLKPGSHAFDRMLVNRGNNKLMMMDAKAVSKRVHYPDTGISIAHRNTYLSFANQNPCIPFLLLFIDCELKEVYGATLEHLEQKIEIDHNGRILSYPWECENFSAVGGKIVYYPMSLMNRGLYYLNDDEIAELRDLSNYGYEQDMDHKPGYQEWADERGQS